MSSDMSYSEKILHLNQWFKENSKLPEEIDSILLRRFLKCMKGDLEETKKLIELNYQLRNKNPEIFIDRDPKSEQSLKTYGVVDIVTLPGLTPDKNKLLIFRLTEKDVKLQNSLEECRVFFMVSDVNFTELDLEDKAASRNDEEVKVKPQESIEQIKDDDEDNEDEDEFFDDEEEFYDKHLADGQIHIMDVGNYTLRHMASMSLSLTRTYMNYLQEAYPLRLKALHVINCPTYLNRMIAITRPFIRDDVFQMMHFHTEGLESLYEHIPKDMLPSDYGGKLESLTELKQKYWHKISDKRNYLMDSKQWLVEQLQSRSSWSWW